MGESCADESCMGEPFGGHEPPMIVAPGRPRNEGWRTKKMGRRRRTRGGWDHRAAQSASVHACVCVCGGHSVATHRYRPNRIESGGGETRALHYRQTGKRTARRRPWEATSYPPSPSSPCPTKATNKRHHNHHCRRRRHHHHPGWRPL